jgi:hypothetical protein
MVLRFVIFVLTSLSKVVGCLDSPNLRGSKPEFDSKAAALCLTVLVELQAASVRRPEIANQE